jgi:cyclic pyranopterin phosphate synthase
MRISVTDRCNIRCAYCIGVGANRFLPRRDLLSFEEIVRIAGVAATLGIGKLRLTGGEPLLRRDVDQLVAMLVRVPGIAEVDMTTNGTLLGRFAGRLKKAGLSRLNVSLDAISPETFRQLTDRDQLDRVLEGISAAREAGFEHIKLNAVAIRGISESQIVRLASFARQNQLELRFIEFMPLDSARRWQPDLVLKAEEILAMLEAEFGPLEPVEQHQHGPARQYRYRDGGGTVGVVPAVSDPFCQHCDRLRLTADGKLRNCLFAVSSEDLRAVIRAGGSDEQLVDLFLRCVSAKKLSRGRDDACLVPSDRPMHKIGG